MAIRTTADRLQQNIIDKTVTLSGDVILDDVNTANNAAANVDDVAKSFGKYGYDMLPASSETVVPAGTYYAVHFINQTVVTFFRGTECTGVMTGTYPQGCVLYLDITDLTISTGGPAVLYKNGS